MKIKKNCIENNKKNGKMLVKVACIHNIVSQVTNSIHFYSTVNMYH